MSQTESRIFARIAGTGSCLPAQVVSNDDLAKRVETSDEWIMERIGVKTRHILKPEQGSGTSYMMIRAVRQLLEKTQADPALPPNTKVYANLAAVAESLSA